MPPPRSHPADDPTWTLEVVSPGHDFIVRCKVKDENWMEAGQVKPEFGEEPEAKSQLVGYKLSGITRADEAGWHYLYYAKERDAQEAYNWTHANLLENEWPEVRQNWIWPREEYVAEDHEPPPALGEHTWTFIGPRTMELGPELSGLFIGEVHVWRDISSPLVSEVIDLETNEIVTTEKSMVVSGTPAQPVNAQGIFSTVTHVNTRWSIKQLLQIGWKPTQGRALRVTNYGAPWSLPSVLKYIAIIPLHANSQDIFSEVVRYIIVKKWLGVAGAYACRIMLEERWFSEEPVIGGDPDWDSTKNTSPELLMPVAFVETPIDFGGVELNIYVPACLHGAYRFYDSGYTDEFPATEYSRLPASFLGKVSLTREQGGYVARYWWITPPASLTNKITLKQYGASTTTTATVEWSPNSSGVNEETRMDVATDPSFASGWLDGYRDKLVTPVANTPPLRHTIINLVQGRHYYVRVRRPALEQESETILITGLGLAELQVTRAGAILQSGNEVIIGSVETGGRLSLDLVLKSTGLLSVRNIAVSVPVDSMFSLGAVPTALEFGQSATIAVRFDPTSAGNHQDVLTITSEAVGSPFTLTLKGTGLAPNLRLDQPAGSEQSSGASLSFGTVTTGTVSKTFKLLNIGNAPLRALALAITGTNAGDWTITSNLASDVIAPGAYQNFTLRFDPVESEAAAPARVAVLNIASDDPDQNPFTLNLTGTSANPNAPGAVDWTFDVAINGNVLALAMETDGSVVVGGSFSNVGGILRANLTRLDPDGTVVPTVNTNDTVRAIAVTGDGILFGGDFTIANLQPRNRLAKINHGTTLQAFDPDANGAVHCLLVDATTGKIYVGGAFTVIAGATVNRLARLNADGTHDASFTAPAEINSTVRGLAFNAAGKLVIVGDWAAVPPSSTPPSSTPPSSTPPSSTPPSSTPPSSTPPSSTPPSSTPPSSTPPSSTPPSSTPPSSTPPSSMPPSSTPPSSTPPSSTPPSSTPPSSAPPSSPPPSSTPPSSPPPSSTP